MNDNPPLPKETSTISMGQLGELRKDGWLIRTEPKKEDRTHYWIMHKGRVVAVAKVIGQGADRRSRRFLCNGQSHLTLTAILSEVAAAHEATLLE